MSVKIEMNHDIRDFSPKIFGPFTLRQIICLLICVPVFFLFFLILPLDIAEKIIVSILPCIPIILCGWVTVYEIPLEKFLFRHFFPFIFSEKERIYEAEGIFDLEAEKEDAWKVPKKVKKSKEKPMK